MLKRVQHDDFSPRHPGLDPGSDFFGSHEDTKTTKNRAIFVSSCEIEMDRDSRFCGNQEPS